jgi:hypothetical protein
MNGGDRWRSLQSRKKNHVRAVARYSALQIFRDARNAARKPVSAIEAIAAKPAAIRA